MKKLGQFIAVVAALGLWAGTALAQTATQLPNAMTQFIDGNGAPYAAGKVFFYVPGTTTPKTTWVDVNQATANTNPVVLDSAGRALIYGAGVYREVLWDQFGNTIWDQLTWATNPSLGQSFAPGVLAGNPGPGVGPLSAITVGAGLQLTGSVLSTTATYPTTVADSGTSCTVSITGLTITNCVTVTSAFNNTQRYASGTLAYVLPAGATLVNGFSFRIYALTGNVTIVPYSTDSLGQLATAAYLTIPKGSALWLTGSGGTGWEYSLSYNDNSNLQAPCGRLTLTSGVPVLSSNVTAATTVYFSPYGGCTTVPVWNGSQFMTVPFAETSQLLSDTTLSPAAGVAGAVYDYFEWLNSAGAIVVTRGPAWGSVTNRGYTLSRSGGLLVNTAAITNGPGAGAGVYVGTVACDVGAATVSFNPLPAAASGGPTNGAYVGVWNEFYRVPVLLSVQDSKASWTYTSTTWRNADNTANNRVTFVSGLAEDGFTASYQIVAGGTSTLIPAISIGLDSTTVPTIVEQGAETTGSPSSSSIFVSYPSGPVLGQHYLQALEASSGSTSTFNGSVSGPTGQAMNLYALWRF